MHLLFWSGDRLVGTMEVPSCFNPNGEFLRAALDLGITVGRSHWGVPEGLDVAGESIYDNIAQHAEALRSRGIRILLTPDESAVIDQWLDDHGVPEDAR